jgi:hypothetical protein
MMACEPNIWLAENFGLYRKQDGNGSMGISSHWLAMGQNKTAGLSHDHRADKQKMRTGV